MDAFQTQLWFDVGIKRYTTLLKFVRSVLWLWFDVGIKRYTTRSTMIYQQTSCGLMQESKDIQLTASVLAAVLRSRISYPIIRGWKVWAQDEYPNALPKSPIGKALNYLITRIKQLAAYTKDGLYMIDNNPIENCVQPLAGDSAVSVPPVAL